MSLESSVLILLKTVFQILKIMKSTSIKLLDSCVQNAKKIIFGTTTKRSENVKNVERSLKDAQFALKHHRKSPIFVLNAKMK